MNTTDKQGIDYIYSYIGEKLKYGSKLSIYMHAQDYKVKVLISDRLNNRKHVKTA